MTTTKRIDSKVKRAQLMTLAIAIARRDYQRAQALARILGPDSAAVGTWRYHGQQFADWLEDIDQAPTGQIFTRGNAKLPFYNFSALPIVTCPGAGICAEFCYSLKAWRYPSAYFAQCRNTVLVLQQSSHLVGAWHKLPVNVPVRLYVDGDFDSVETLAFWFRLLEDRPDLQAYGYSKSFDVLESYQGAWPNNYKLNLSSGGNRVPSDKVRALPITRGEFLTLPVPAHLAGKYDNPDYKRELRRAGRDRGIDKAFLCPGKCGSCVRSGHACGQSSFKDIPILIGQH